MKLTAEDLNKTVLFKGLLKWEDGEAVNIRLLEDNSIDDSLYTYTLQQVEYDCLYSYFDEVATQVEVRGVWLFIGSVYYVRMPDEEGIKQWDFTIKVLAFADLGNVDYATFVPEVNLAELLPK
ncbi:hypothetical protein NSTCB13_02636 [Nostoc sp. DSM 114160]|jgi:hypothetical protein